LQRRRVDRLSEAQDTLIARISTVDNSTGAYLQVCLINIKLDTISSTQPTKTHNYADQVWEFDKMYDRTCVTFPSPPFNILNESRGEVGPGIGFTIALAGLLNVCNEFPHRRNPWDDVLIINSPVISLQQTGPCCRGLQLRLLGKIRKA
jgi:hypothetical protein